MFADVSGFTALADELDPETVTDIITAIISELSEVVGRYDGYVDKYAGDALLAFFGAPVSHEDDAERALACALEMHERFAAIRPRLGDEAQALGLFFYKRWKARHTHYALTDRRAISITTGRRRSIRAEFIDRVAAVNHKIRSDGSGTIVFGNPSSVASMYSNTGMELFSKGYSDPGLAFYDLRDAHEVVRIIDGLRRGQ